MDIFKGNNRQESITGFNLEKVSPKSNIWGIFYVVLGIGGLVFSVVFLWHNMKEAMPEYGAIMACILTGTVSQFILVYGCGILRRSM